MRKPKWLIQEDYDYLFNVALCDDYVEDIIELIDSYRQKEEYENNS